MEFPSPRVEEIWRHFKDDLSADVVDVLASMPDVFDVLDASEYVVLQCQRHADMVVALHQQGTLESGYAEGDLRKQLVDALSGVSDEAQLSRVLRFFRRQQMVRIIWRDITRIAGLDETLEDLSELADVCVDEAVKLLFSWAVKKSGMPRDADGNAQELIVIGMGKLGARELNLSSDIDLIFAYPERGQTDGKRPLDNEQFFTRLARQVIKAIGENTADGYVFRVDTRLRPFGDAGPLVIPLGFLMGIMFPRGLTHVAEQDPDLVPWAWAINGTLSVISAIAAALLALSFGFSAVVRVGAIAYGLTAILAPDVHVIPRRG